ncbi:MAG: aminopeptidase P family protein [Burkholderiales bacterium]|nr:aminopeptidase P family protein [Burkholderiales bacterium]
MNSPVSPSAITSPIPARLVQLRAAMQAQGLDAYIVPSSDPHLSEYLPDRWQGRSYFSGFTGSVGTLIVTADFAGLWVDSRYWSSAEVELAPTGIKMMKIASAAATLYIDWLASNLQPGQTVGVDGAVLGLATARALEQALQSKGITFNTSHDLLDKVWNERPSLPQAAIYEHAAPYAVVARADKLAMIREQMRSKNADWHFVSTVDDLAWIFNLRGADVSYNPVFVGHALISQTEAKLFVSNGKVSAELAAVLAKDGVRLADYSEAASTLATLPADSSIMIDPRRITYGFRQSIPATVKVIEAINPSVFAKSRKTGEEAQFVREAMEQDGAALCEFFSWLEGALGKQRITELTIDEEICAARARQPQFVSPSFNTIAGFNANGAMPHYRATQESHSVIEGNGLLLIDSGGQYLNGTTDITRVVPMGQVSEAQKRDFTLVLKGMINLSQMRYPRGTLSPMLDTVARAPIWADGINYGHGTGHGVGYFLNVHEGPQSISSTVAEAHMAMEPGMITSNEPGIYRPGKWGVRIENLLLNVPAMQTEFGEYLEFETLTLCPIDTRCITVDLLREDEIKWLNDYHAMVLQRLSPRVSGAALEWLKERTKPLLRSAS